MTRTPEEEIDFWSFSDDPDFAHIQPEPFDYQAWKANWDAWIARCDKKWNEKILPEFIAFKKDVALKFCNELLLDAFKNKNKTAIEMYSEIKDFLKEK